MADENNIKFQDFLDKYKNEYADFSKLYPNKTLSGETLTSNDPTLNTIFDVSLNVLHEIEKTQEYIKEKNNLKLACEELKHIFAPMPPMSIVQFDQNIACCIPKQSFIRIESKTEKTNLLDKDNKKTLYNSNSDKNKPYHLRTCFDIHVLPIKIDKLKYHESSGVNSHHSLLFEIISNTSKPLLLNNYSCHQLTFYINERLENAFFIYDMLMKNTKSIQLTLENIETKEVKKYTLTRENIKSLGFEPDEFASSTSLDSPNNLSALKDYLYFPNKFMFFKIEIPEEVLSQSFTSLKFNFSFGEQKKQNYNLPSNSLELFCSPVTYFEEDITKVIRLRKGATEVVVAGKNHGSDAIHYKNGKIINTYLKEEIINSNQVESNNPINKLSCRPYFQNTDQNHSSLAIGLSTNSPSVTHNNCSLMVNVKSFYSEAKIFENTPIKFGEISSKISTILTPSKRRDLKNIALDSMNKVFYMNSNKFDITNKDVMNNIINIVDYSYNKKDFDENAIKKFLDLIDDIKSEHVHDESDGSFDEIQKIEKVFHMNVQQDKVNGLSVALISNILKTLDIESSTINQNLKEVRINF